MPKRRGELRDFVSGFTGGWKMMADAQHQKIIQDYYKSKSGDGRQTPEALGLTGGGGYISKIFGGDAGVGTHPLAGDYAAAKTDKERTNIYYQALYNKAKAEGDPEGMAKAANGITLYNKLDAAENNKSPGNNAKITNVPRGSSSGAGRPSGRRSDAEDTGQPKVNVAAVNNPDQSEEDRWKSRIQAPATVGSNEIAPTQGVADVQPNQEPVDVAEADTQAMPEAPMDDTMFSATGGMVPTRYAESGGMMDDDQSPLGALQQYDRAKEAGAIPTTPAPTAPPVTPGSVDPLTRKEYAPVSDDSNGPLANIFNLSKLGVAIGLKNINDDLKSDAALPQADPNRQAKFQAVSNNVGRFSTDEIKAIDAKIDPNNELPADAKSHARMAAALTYFKNDPEAGKTMLSRLIMTDKFASQTRGALALQALQNNDVQSAAKLIADAYNMNDYDGRKMTPIFNRDGTVTAQVTQDGKVVDSVTANKPQMVQLASNVANGDEFLQRAARVAQAYTDSKTKGTGTGNNLTAKDLEILKGTGHTVNEEGNVVPLPPNGSERPDGSTEPAQSAPASAIPASPGYNPQGKLPTFASGQNNEDYATQGNGVPGAGFPMARQVEGSAIPSVSNPPAAIPSGTASPEAGAPTVTPAETPAPAGGQGTPAETPAPTSRQSAIPTTPSGLPPQVRGPATENGEYRGTFERTPFDKPEPKYTPPITNDQYASMSKAGRAAADKVIARSRQEYTDAHKSWAEDRKEHNKEQDRRRDVELAYGREQRSAALADIRTKENAAIADKRSQDAAKRQQQHDRDMEEARQRNAIFLKALEAKKPLDFNKNDQDDLDKFQGHVETVIKDALTNATDSKGKPANIDPEKFNTFYPVRQVRMMRDATVDLHRYNNMTPETAANVVLSMTNPGMQSAIDSSVARAVPRQMPFEANYNGSTDNDKVLEGRAPNSAGLSQYTIQAIPQTPYDSPNDPRVFVRFKDNSGPLTGVILPKSAVDMIDTVRGQQLKRLAMEADAESSAKSKAAGTKRVVERENKFLEDQYGAVPTIPSLAPPPSFSTRRKEPSKGLLNN